MTIGLISTKFTYFTAFIYHTLHTKNLKEITPAVPEVRVPEIYRIFMFFFFTPDEKCTCKQPSRASISMKFGTLIALPKSYISIKFGTIPSKFEEDITDSR